MLTLQTVRQAVVSRPMTDVAGSVRRQVEAVGASLALPAGATVAVGCSSRGIANYAEIVGAVVTGLRGLGFAPFCFPAMGSHGSATGPGQARVLAAAGITEAAMGCPVRSSLDTVTVATLPNGMPVLVDRHAYEADAFVVVNRVKPHTEFTHRFESGLMKMMAIGMGKEAGATVYHRYFLRDGYAATIEAIAARVTAARPLLFGVGIAEDGAGATAEVEVMPAARLVDAEARMLARVQAMLPRLPFDDLDVLVVDEMGKDISGSGMDTKVIGRLAMPLLGPDPERPRIKRVVCGELTAASGGNADGVGLADFITARLSDQIDRQALYVNALAGSEPEHARIPMVLPTMRDAVAAAMATVGPIEPADLRLVHIRNTASLATWEVSAALLPECAAQPALSLVGEPFPLTFTAGGDLVSLR